MSEEFTLITVDFYPVYSRTVSDPVPLILFFSLSHTVIYWSFSIHDRTVQDRVKPRTIDQIPPFSMFTYTI